MRHLTFGSSRFSAVSYYIAKWSDLKTFLLLQSHLDVELAQQVRRPTKEFDHESIDEETMQKVRTQLFMNQLNDAETGNADTPEQIGATGGIPAVNEPVLPPHPVVKHEPNVNIVNEYNSFNLANVTPPVPPKWKTSDTLLDDFRKFRRLCQCIFNGPMCHITSGKVKTSMLLIWAGPDGEDIYENFNLPIHQKHDVDFVLNKFEDFCEPICNFRIAHFKLCKVHQYQGESIDVFYNRILKVARQCEFSNTDERLINAIIFGTNCTKAQDKLLQTPKTLSLQQCLSVC